MIKKIDPTKLMKLLIKAEQKVARSGWNEPSHLAYITVRQNPARLAFSRIPMEIQDPPVEFLMHVANTMITDSTVASGIIREVGANNFYGMSFVSEGWMLKDENMIKTYMADETLRIEDMNERVEVRSISVVTVWGELYTLVRERGAAAQVDLINEKPEARIFGRVNLSLISMVRYITDHLPDGEAYVDAQCDLIRLYQRSEAEVTEKYGPHAGEGRVAKEESQ